MHPLLSSICYEQAPLWKRRAVHRALAGVVSDVEERARHLAVAVDGPDAAVASPLQTAAGQAAARGATAAAAELFELAAGLTPGDPPLARQRRLQSAHFHRLAGEGDRAALMLDQLLTEVPFGVERADILFGLAVTFRTKSAEMNELFEEAVAEAVGDDARSTRILALRSLFRLLAVDVRGALTDAHAALERAERVGDPGLLAAAIRGWDTRSRGGRRSRPDSSSAVRRSRTASGSSSSSTRAPVCGWAGSSCAGARSSASRDLRSPRGEGGSAR